MATQTGNPETIAMDRDSYKFPVRPNDDMKCLKCSQVALEPWQHGRCGRLFCKLCLEIHGKDKPCPECKSFEPMPKYFEDNRSKKNIDALHVKCTNGMGSMACNWIGRFCALEEHSAMCSYARAPCPYKCKDDNNDVRRFNKRILGDHMAKECPNREHTCQNCGEKDTYAFITEVHDEVCKKKMVPCPNVECVSKVQRRGVKRHLDVCSYTEIPCKYAKLGCDTTMKRSIITEHQCDDQAHFRFAMNTVVWLEKELKLLKQRGGLVLQNGASTTFKMTRYQQRKDANEIFSAPHFSTSDGHFVVIQVHANGSGNAAGQHLSIITQVSADGNRSDGDQVPFNGNITIQLLNQLTNDNHHMKTGRTVVKFIAANKLALNSTKKTQYLKDDTLYFKVTIDIPNQRPWLECTAS